MKVTPQGALYVLPVLRSIAYLCLKICSIALSKKLLDEVLENETDPELYQALNEDVLSTAQDSITTRIFLMDGLDFYGAFAVTSGLVLAASIIHPVHTMMAKFRFNFQEVKRLQTVLYKYFILQPNSVAIKEANDLLYTKIPIVEKYWARAKYEVVGDLTACFVGMLLTIILAWDLGLMYMGALLVVFVGSDVIRTKMSTPWDEQRERKQAATNAHLTDLVLCKELIITNAQETNEFDLLKEKIKEDEEDIRRLSIAHLVSEFVECSTFFMFTPLLFLFVFTVDPTLERLFQMLVLIVITDEVVRSYLAYSKNRLIVEEYNRAQQDFCNVLGMSKDQIFPPDIVWPTWLSRATTNPGKKRNSGTQRTDDPTDFHLQSEYPEEEEAYESYLLHESYCSSAFTGPNLAGNFFAAPSGGKTEKMVLSNMALGYHTLEGRNFCAIDGLNLSLELGEHYSIMGESGAGKSTILKSLAGLVPPLYGTISARGKDLETTSVSWREQVAVVSQTSVLFNRTLRENLCYGARQEVSDEDIYSVLDSVNLRDRVIGLPDGLDTIVAKNGHEFSGGQLQRLSIAHLLLSSKDCTLVLVRLQRFEEMIGSASFLDILTKFFTLSSFLPRWMSPQGTLKSSNPRQKAITSSFSSSHFWNCSFPQCLGFHLRGSRLCHSPRLPQG